MDWETKPALIIMKMVRLIHVTPISNTTQTHTSNHVTFGNDAAGQALEKSQTGLSSWLELNSGAGFRNTRSRTEGKMNWVPFKCQSLKKRLCDPSSSYQIWHIWNGIPYCSGFGHLSTSPCRCSLVIYGTMGRFEDQKGLILYGLCWDQH